VADTVWVIIYNMTIMSASDDLIVITTVIHLNIYLEDRQIFRTLIYFCFHQQIVSFALLT